MARRIDNNIPRAQYLDLLPVGCQDSLYIAICVSVYKSKIRQYSKTHNASRCVEYCKKLLFTKFEIPDECVSEIKGQSTSKAYNVGHGSIKKPVDILSQDRSMKLGELLRKFKPWMEKYELDQGSEIETGEEGCIYENMETQKKQNMEYFQADLLEIETSGLTVPQIHFVFANSLRHNFAINIVGIFGQK